MVDPIYETYMFHILSIYETYMKREIIYVSYMTHIRNIYNLFFTGSDNNYQANAARGKEGKTERRRH